MLRPSRESIFWRNGDILHDLLSWQAPYLVCRHYGGKCRNSILFMEGIF